MNSVASLAGFMQWMKKIATKQSKPLTQRNGALEAICEKKTKQNVQQNQSSD
ncbi:hypothetical protein [Chromobacterium piscinae]|uniref:hypothetical protein n=1 Tax=Chromobacterium piscinae TaxID=686831 RepID=UPI00140C768B|nr:hypothetical protein [Chromobacterium piscinae]MBX9298713.1 hypothetical protein [Chromobacterium vaccinii]MBX9348305.1 hypothetical protein [Chromobacterium vaccinii]MBX9357294.1 hypothetical protein [Chromobacterium vaccinii]MCD4503418.1 hypothetical protein [Chromobacterium piscinae]MCD5329198.1 hypothetical protein [Chromobacterium piscinae]